MQQIIHSESYFHLYLLKQLHFILKENPLKNMLINASRNWKCNNVIKNIWNSKYLTSYIHVIH